MWKNFNFVTKYFTKRRQRYITKTIAMNKQEFQLREITYQDIKDLLAIEREVYAGELPWTMSAFMAELGSKAPHLYLLAAINGKTVGFIGCRIQGTDAHITNVAVHTAYQGLGLGRSLIEETRIFAKKNRCETLSLEVRMSNVKAQRLYRKIGFVSQTVKKGYYDENNEDALEMIIDLKEE